MTYIFVVRFSNHFSMTSWQIRNQIKMAELTIELAGLSCFLDKIDEKQLLIYYYVLKQHSLRYQGYTTIDPELRHCSAHCVDKKDLNIVYILFTINLWPSLVYILSQVGIRKKGARFYHFLFVVRSFPKCWTFLLIYGKKNRWFTWVK